MVGSKRQTVFVTDTPENFVVNNRLIDGFVAYSGITKGAFIQGAIQNETRPKDPQLESLEIGYVHGEVSDLSIIAAFFRRAGDDVDRGMPRFNCGHVLDRTRTYLRDCLCKEPYAREDGLWASEAVSLMSSEWDAREYDAKSFYEIAELIEKQDAMPSKPISQNMGVKEGFLFSLILEMDKAIQEWGDADAMKRYDKVPLSIPMNSGRDSLVIPHPKHYAILNPLDAPLSSCAAVVSVRNKGTLEVPYFIFFSNFDPCEFTVQLKESLHAAMASICPDYARVLEMKVEPKMENGKCVNVDAHLNSPYPGFFPIEDSDSISLAYDERASRNRLPFIIRGRVSAQ